MNPPWVTVEALGPLHDISRFHCGLESVDAWFQGNALAEENAGRTRTKVCVGPDGLVMAFFSMRHIVVSVKQYSNTLKKSADPHDTGNSTGLLLAWMGRDEHFPGTGKALMREVFRHAAAAHKQASYGLLVVDPANDGLTDFYEGFGFRLIPNERRMVMKSSSLLRITARMG